LSCGSVCRSCVTVIARLASTHTALVSQSLVGLCFAFPSINQYSCNNPRTYHVSGGWAGPPLLVVGEAVASAPALRRRPK